MKYHEELAGAWEQCEEEGAAERLLCTYCSPCCATQGRMEESGMKESMWALKWRVGELFH